MIEQHNTIQCFYCNFEFVIKSHQREEEKTIVDIKTPNIH